ncbi:MAG: hypothetical protein ACI9LN_004505 [Saprospiraceae bacterium]|jgi:hypothetical protein
MIFDSRLISTIKLANKNKMNKDNTIAYNNETNPNREEMDKVKDVLPRSFNFYWRGAVWGVLAGALMAFFLLTLQAIVEENLITIGFLKYGILAVVLGFALTNYKRYLNKDSIFKNGILYGAYITLLSAGILTLVNMAIFKFIGGFSVKKFGVKANDFADFFSVSGAIFFEVFILGMIITFIILQYLKSTFKPNEGLK